MKIELKNLSYYYVVARTDISELYPGKNRMIKAMKQIFPIIRPYISMKSYKSWMKLKQIKIESVFETFLEIVTDSLRTPISGYDIKYLNDRYVIEIYCYPDIQQDYMFYYMPFNWLLDLKYVNKKLHDICLDMFRILEGQCGIYSMDELGNDDWYIDSEEENLEYNEFDDRSKKYVENKLDLYYKYGVKYYKMIHNENPDIDDFRERVYEYEPVVMAEEIMINLAEKVIRLTEQPHTFQFFIDKATEKFANINDIEKDEFGQYKYPDGEPVNIAEVMSIGWFSDEIFIDQCVSWISERAGNFGHADYCQSYICANSQDLTDARKKYREDSGDFLEILADFFDYGMENMKAIHDYSKGRLTQTLFTLNETGTEDRF